MSHKRFFGLFLSLMIAAGFFAGTGCKPEPPDNCTAFDNATTPAPAYAAVESFTTVFGRNNDPTDIYYPAGMDNTTRLPMALLLQGGRCDKQYYSMFATVKLQNTALSSLCPIITMNSSWAHGH